MSKITKESLVKILLPEIMKRMKLNETTDMTNQMDEPNSVTDIDDIGDFYVITHPQEGKNSDDIKYKTNIMDLLNKHKSGELTPENIRCIVKKEGSATNRANKVIKQFSKELLQSRKMQLDELINKKNGYSEQVNGYLKTKKNVVLDEETNGKVKRVQEVIADLEHKIVDLKNLIKNGR